MTFYVKRARATNRSGFHELRGFFLSTMQRAQTARSHMRRLAYAAGPRPRKTMLAEAHGAHFVFIKQGRFLNDGFC